MTNASLTSTHHDDDGWPLTPREQRVLELIAAGYRAKEIGRILQISTATVRFHARGATEKLHARSLPHAVAEALRRRIIRYAPPPLTQRTSVSTSSRYGSPPATASTAVASARGRSAVDLTGP